MTENNQQKSEYNRMQKTHKILLIGLYLLVGNIHAHDFWLEAHPFYTEPDKTVELSIHVGNHFVGDSLPNIVNWYNDFSLYYQDGNTEEVAGEMGRDPAGYFKPEKSGTYAIGYQSLFSNTDIDPDTFNKYLRDEGLLNALSYRETHREMGKIGKERYIRHAKILVQSGNNFEIDSSGYTFGYELEIIPQQNPYSLNQGDELEVILLFRNQPAQNIQIASFSQKKPEEIQLVRTDQQGKATIKLNQTGPWLIKAVNIIHLQSEDPQWQSHWASLTFAIKSR